MPSGDHQLHAADLCAASYDIEPCAAEAVVHYVIGAVIGILSESEGYGAAGAFFHKLRGFGIVGAEDRSSCVSGVFKERCAELIHVFEIVGVVVLYVGYDRRCGGGRRGRNRSTRTPRK